MSCATCRDSRRIPCPDCSPCGCLTCAGSGFIICPKCKRSRAEPDRFVDDVKRPCAAVALITREDGKLLVVWNKRYGKWGFPGGKVEDGETPEAAVMREVTEETGLDTSTHLVELLYEGAHGESVESTRGSYVYLFRVVATGARHRAEERESGCAVTWFTQKEFLMWCLAPAYYQRAFEAMRSERCSRCRRTRPNYIADPTCPKGGYCAWVEPIL